MSRLLALPILATALIGSGRHAEAQEVEPPASSEAAAQEGPPGSSEAPVDLSPQAPAQEERTPGADATREVRPPSSSESPSRLALSGSDDHAQGSPVFGRYDSPQWFALELRFGPYSPDVDEEFDGAAKPHEAIFGSKRRLMTQIELDLQLFRGFGSAGVGVQVGFFRERARAFVLGEDRMPTTVRSGDRTELVLVPVALLGVYRMDEAARRWRFPLVPYVKAGFNYTFWWIYDGNDDVPRVLGGKGRGGSLGWQGAVGLSFLLDVLDFGSSRAFDEETGVNHTYVFAELVHVESPAFGKTSLHVGDTTWAAGLTFEF